MGEDLPSRSPVTSFFRLSELIGANCSIFFSQKFRRRKLVFLISTLLNSQSQDFHYLLLCMITKPHTRWSE